MTCKTPMTARLAASLACACAAALVGCGGGGGPDGAASVMHAAAEADGEPGAAAPAARASGPVDLGAEPAGERSRVVAIGGGGEAAGVLGSGTLFVWDEKRGARRIEGLPDCGGERLVLEPGDINARGQVVGTLRCIRVRESDDITTVSTRAFVWSPQDGVRLLPQPPGRQHTQAAAINGHGAVAGWVSAGALARPQAVVWLPDGTVRSLGEEAGPQGSVASDINDRGEVVGTAGQHAFLWSEREGLRDLGTLGGPSSSAARINDRGHVVGTSTTGTTPVVSGFLWTPAGGMKGLGTLDGGHASFANAIGEDDVVVGSSTDASGHSRPVLWTAAGGIETLDAGGASGEATAIDGAGRVVGNLYSGPARVLRAVAWQLQPAANAPVTLWRDTARPAVEVDPDTSPVELGLRFRVSEAGHVPGLRFYKGVVDIGPYTVSLWNDAGERIASAVVGTHGTGWIRVDFPRPVALEPGRVYVASYFAPRGAYPASEGYFAGSGARSGPIEALADDAAGPNGVYRYGPEGGFPDRSYRATNYWVDVVFVPGHLPPVGFWNDTSLPRTAAVDDPNPVELGLRWRSSQAGLVSAIRFYRGAPSTRPYTVNLWTAEGEQLFSAATADGTGTGWITVRLPRPVAVEPRRDYVVSYFAPEGRYAADNDFFASAPGLAWMLEAPADAPGAGNGLYAYGPHSSFPAHSWRATNYWLDLVFEPR